MKKDKNIFSISNKDPIRITQDILDKIKVGDWVCSQHNDPSLYGDHDSDDYYSFDIHRDVEETEEEINKRVESAKKQAIFTKRNRYQNYLKLKKNLIIKII